MQRGIQIIDPEERFTLDMDGAHFKLRRIDSATLMAIERSVGGGQEESRQMNDEVLDYVLVDWEGVTSPLGETEVPCTRENKLKLPTSAKLKVLAAVQGARAEDQPA
ncbi:MAG: hypothetical protein PVG03_01815 [Desulfarculaceae bacterium]